MDVEDLAHAGRKGATEGTGRITGHIRILRHVDVGQIARQGPIGGGCTVVDEFDTGDATANATRRVQCEGETDAVASVKFIAVAHSCGPGAERELRARVHELVRVIDGSGCERMSRSKCGCSGIPRSPHSFQKRCGPVVRSGGARAAGWPVGTSPRAHAGPLGWHTALLHAPSMLRNACIAMTSARRNLKLTNQFISIVTLVV